MLTAEWIDREREPKCSPDPKYPKGMDVDTSDGAAKTCSLDLPLYPTPRCGLYVVTCSQCGMKVALTTAGRPDDPRKVTLGCYSQVLEPGFRIPLPGTPHQRRTPHVEKN